MSTQLQNTILIVDDTATVRETLESLLYPAGYKILLAENAQQALNILPNEPVDVILLDVMMPDIDGLTLCRQLKAHPQWQHIPIIIITALNSRQDLIAALEAGTDEFLTKPVNGIELRARVRSMLRLKHQFDELQRALKLREDLSHMIVHDMRSPLMAIMGFSQMMKDDTNLTASQTEDIGVIHRLANQVNSFINDLLLIAKMEANKLGINPSSVDLVQLITKVQTGQNIIAQSKNIKLTFTPPTEAIAPQMVDANLIERVIDNLISNAVKYSPKNSTITLRLQNETHLQLQVIDEGYGIPPEHHGTIFNKFEIVNLRNEGITQTGLGLTFCKLVMDAHEGDISVKSNVPKGSIFTITFNP